MSDLSNETKDNLTELEDYKKSLFMYVKEMYGKNDLTVQSLISAIDELENKDKAFKEYVDEIHLVDDLNLMKKEAELKRQGKVKKPSKLKDVGNLIKIENLKEVEFEDGLLPNKVVIPIKSKEIKKLNLSKDFINEQFFDEKEIETTSPEFILRRNKLHEAIKKYSILNEITTRRYFNERLLPKNIEDALLKDLKVGDFLEILNKNLNLKKDE
jgi:hypothetical protein